ncbi:MAG: hypothetical protein VB108_01080 [Anaerolineaceae bacterium]|nr:hypothetical protein [Anaerolineaceae bacterium]
MAHIEINTGSYNQRRFSRPWIAKIDFSQNPKGDYKFGSWVGDHNNGSDGVLVINAEEGDVIAQGQKDFRQPKNNVPDYYIVKNGQLVHLESKAEAYQMAQNK